MSKRISRKLSFLVFALLAFAAIATAQTPAPVFKAGAARRDDVGLWRQARRAVGGNA
jgi:hypothetical protein